MAEVAVAGTDITWAATTIPNVESFNGIGIANDTIDVTDIAETIASQISAKVYRGEEVSLTINHDPNDTIHKLLAADCLAGNSKVLSIQFPDAGTTDYTCNAFVTRFSPSGSKGGQLQVEVTFQPTDTITL